MIYYHYLTAGALRHALARLSIGYDGPLLFSPSREWAPTSFALRRRETPYRALTREEMLQQGVCRIGLSESELEPIAAIGRAYGLDFRFAQQVRVLRRAGVELTGWRVLAKSISVADVVVHRLHKGGAWQPMVRLSFFGAKQPIWQGEEA